MGLPTPPTLQEIRTHTPRIEPVCEGTDRPFWSVMIPIYNTGPYLCRTLQSVLCQDLGPREMQIEVVDGCSTQDDPEAVVKELGGGRVTFHRLACNRGVAHTLNTCIQRSRGHWVHLLHGDDLVMPGFYRTYAAVIAAHPQVRTVLGQVVLIDEDDRWMGLEGTAPPSGGGILKDFAERQACRQLAQAPGVVVRRDAYEEIGGFCTLFDHTIDWDMWFRLGQLAPVACVPRPYALYRQHRTSETNRLKVSAANIRDSYLVVTANLARLNGSAGAARDQPWRTRLAAAAEAFAWELDRRNCTEGRYNQARWAWMLEPTSRRLIMLLKSWLKHKLTRHTSASR